MNFTQNFLNEEKENILSKVHSAEIKISNQWYQGEITKEINDDEVSVIATFQNFNDNEIIIDAVRLIDIAKNVIVIHEKKITKLKSDGLCFVIKLKVRDGSGVY